MSRRTVKPEAIKSLKDWSVRWPANGNLGFDAETREPAVYDTAAADRKQVKKIAWERAGDTLTILAQPDRFSEGAVKAAASRLGKIREQRAAYEKTAADQLRTAEHALLEAWRVYRSADATARGVLRRDVLTAEKAVRDLEIAAAAQIQVGRSAVTQIGMVPDGGVVTFVSIYVPPMPLDRRGIPISAAAGAVAGTASSSEE